MDRSEYNLRLQNLMDKIGNIRIEVVSLINDSAKCKDVELEDWSILWMIPHI